MKYTEEQEKQWDDVKKYLPTTWADEEKIKEEFFLNPKDILKKVKESK